MDIQTLKGLEVEHATFHKGIVIETEGIESEGYITVEFKENNKVVRFVYPDAFIKYIKADQYRDEIDSDIQKKREKQELAANEQAQKRLKEEEERRNKVLRAKSVKSKTQTPKSKSIEGHNIAFKCTFCDGGADETHLGFNGVCSQGNRDYNQNIAKTAWCSYYDCPCKRYTNGEISYQQLIDIYNEGSLVCYESLMLKDWKAYAGTDLSGEVEYKRRNIAKLHMDNVAILTTREPSSDEQDRIVFAVFIVAGGYFGDDQNEGFVKAHDKYRISLTKKEARSLKFWNYYRNSSNPDNEKWGTGLYRYLDNQQVSTLLDDIVKLKEGTDDENLAKEFSEYFLSKNKITDNMLINRRINITEGDSFDRIVDVLNECFGRSYKGFQQCYVDVGNNYYMWCPKVAILENGTYHAANREYGFINLIEESGDIIYEGNEDPELIEKKYGQYFEKRAVFTKTGNERYIFRGIYEYGGYDKAKKSRIHKRVSKVFNLSEWSQ